MTSHISSSVRNFSQAGIAVSQGPLSSGRPGPPLATRQNRNDSWRRAIAPPSAKLVGIGFSPRAYMPSPKQIFELIAGDLRAVGIEVTGTELPWTPEYLHAVTRGKAHDLHLFGAVGNYGEAYDFLGPLFAQRQDEFGFTDTGLFEQFKQVEKTGEPDARVPQYQRLNARLLELLPSGALGEGLRDVFAGLRPDPTAVIVLIVWAVLAGAVTSRTFRWE